MEKLNTYRNAQTQSTGQLNKAVTNRTQTLSRNHQSGWRDVASGLSWPLRSMNYPLCDLQGNFIGHSV